MVNTFSASLLFYLTIFVYFKTYQALRTLLWNKLINLNNKYYTIVWIKSILISSTTRVGILERHTIVGCGPGIIIVEVYSTVTGKEGMSQSSTPSIKKIAVSMVATVKTYYYVGFIRIGDVQVGKLRPFLKKFC